jgi:hypothetical protein
MQPWDKRNNGSNNSGVSVLNIGRDNKGLDKQSDNANSGLQAIAERVITLEQRHNSTTIEPHSQIFN